MRACVDTVRELCEQNEKGTKTIAIFLYVKLLVIKVYHLIFTIFFLHIYNIKRKCVEDEVWLHNLGIVFNVLCLLFYRFSSGYFFLFSVFHSSKVHNREL